MWLMRPKSPDVYASGVTLVYDIGRHITSNNRHGQHTRWVGVSMHLPAEILHAPTLVEGVGTCLVELDSRYRAWVSVI